MGDWIEDMLDGIDACDNCESKKFEIEMKSFAYHDRTTGKSWGYDDYTEPRTKIMCYDCGENLEEW